MPTPDVERVVEGSIRQEMIKYKYKKIGNLIKYNISEVSHE